MSTLEKIKALIKSNPIPTYKGIEYPWSDNTKGEMVDKIKSVMKNHFHMTQSEILAEIQSFIDCYNIISLPKISRLEKYK